MIAMFCKANTSYCKGLLTSWTLTHTIFSFFFPTGRFYISTFSPSMNLDFSVRLSSSSGTSDSERDSYWTPPSSVLTTRPFRPVICKTNPTTVCTTVFFLQCQCVLFDLTFICLSRTQNQVFFTNVPFFALRQKCRCKPQRHSHFHRDCQWARRECLVATCRRFAPAFEAVLLSARPPFLQPQHCWIHPLCYCHLETVQRNAQIITFVIFCSQSVFSETEVALSFYCTTMTNMEFTKVFWE